MHLIVHSYAAHSHVTTRVRFAARANFTSHQAPMVNGLSRLRQVRIFEDGYLSD
jgi:hypothetical protein